MATPPSILVWRMPWTEEPGGLQSMGHKDLDTAETTWHTCAEVCVYSTFVHSQEWDALGKVKSRD